MTNGDRGGALATEILRSMAREYGWPAFKPVEKTVVRRAGGAGRLRRALRTGARAHALDVRVVDGKLFVVDGEERMELFDKSASKSSKTVEESSISW